MLSTHLGRFRAVALGEGVSYLVLLFLAMPAKYLLDRPEGVRVVGMLHGLLFVAYVGALGLAALERRWGIGRMALAMFVSLVPFGAFWLDARLRAEEAGGLAAVPVTVPLKGAAGEGADAAAGAARADVASSERGDL